MQAEKEVTMTTLITPAAIPYQSNIPFEHERIGAAALYCSDGRYGEQIDDFLHNCLGLPRYDRVAIVGGAACLAGHLLAMRERGALDRQLKFLIESHELNRIVLIAHEGCGFYKQNVHPHKLRQTPLEELQSADLAKAAQYLHNYNPRLDIDAYFAKKTNGSVRFEPVAI
jgi:hypothetical protein